MAEPVIFNEVNFTFTAPEGLEDEVSNLYVYKSEIATVSCWELTKEEIKEVTKTGRVYLSIWGRSMFPVFLGSKETMINSNLLPNE